MTKMVILVINIPKLPLLIALYILILSAAKNIGYTNNNGTFGTVRVKVNATAKFNTQFTVSNINRPG